MVSKLLPEVLVPHLCASLKKRSLAGTLQGKGMLTSQKMQHDPARQVVILEIADKWSRQHLKNHFETHLAHFPYTGPGSRVVDAYIVCPGK